MNRDYDKEYKEYHASKEQKTRRAQRNKARADAERRGSVSKGDGKHVHHPGAPRTGPLPNKTRVVSKKTNLRIQPKRK